MRCAPTLYRSEFNDLLLEIDSDARKLPQDVLPEEPVNLGAHPLTGVRGVHHQDAPIHPMATIKPEVHFVRDVIAFGTRTRFGCLQRPELNRGKASSLRADERLRDSANFPHR